MERVIERGCGLDVHKKSIAACVRLPGDKGQRIQEVRTFGTTAAELLALRDWLEAHRVTHVAMESTGVYWKPPYAWTDPVLVNLNLANQVGRALTIRSWRGSGALARVRQQLRERPRALGRSQAAST